MDIHLGRGYPPGVWMSVCDIYVGYLSGIFIWDIDLGYRPGISIRISIWNNDLGHSCGRGIAVCDMGIAVWDAHARYPREHGISHLR